MPFEVRTAIESDAAEIVTLLRRSIRIACYRDHDNDESKMQAWLANKTIENITIWLQAGSSSCIVVTEQQRVIAMGLIDDRNIIHLCYVDPDHLSKGVGGLLLRELLSIAGSQPETQVTLTSSITAFEFYRYFGFTLQAKITDCYGLDGYEMIKQL